LESSKSLISTTRISSESFILIRREGERIAFEADLGLAVDASFLKVVHSYCFTLVIFN
jgi:hypothetical protein